MAELELQSVSKTYGDLKAVDNFSLSVDKGSFTTLLGPSGCGKTTLLRIIAGFFEPAQGTVRIGGEDQRGIPPERRSAGLVFQDYALFPHMSARENLAYGLRVRKIAAAERNQEIARIAGVLDLDGLLDRYPGELSGGQQQRLALGRAIILKPRILLMDEPLSNLDAKLRVRVREELKDIQRRLGITTIYVTHDQEEALCLSNSIAVIQKGHLEQLGSPEEIYNTPATDFAADFSGPANFIRREGKRFLVRPEWISVYPARTVEAAADAEFTLSGRVTSADFLGRVTRLRVSLDEPSRLSVTQPVIVDAQTVLCPGNAVQLLVKRSWEMSGAPG
jgi:ABC-type Fe3+/spermidine/putrescine transport system ATPase subunit